MSVTKSSEDLQHTHWKDDRHKAYYTRTYYTRYFLYPLKQNSDKTNVWVQDLHFYCP